MYMNHENKETYFNSDEELECDALNDETFGDGTEAWEEAKHMQLSHLNERDRLASQKTNEFFDFNGSNKHIHQNEFKVTNNNIPKTYVSADSNAVIDEFYDPAIKAAKAMDSKLLQCNPTHFLNKVSTEFWSTRWLSSRNSCVTPSNTANCLSNQFFSRKPPINPREISLATSVPPHRYILRFPPPVPSNLNLNLLPDIPYDFNPLQPPPFHRQQWPRRAMPECTPNNYGIISQDKNFCHDQMSSSTDHSYFEMVKTQNEIDHIVPGNVQFQAILQGTMEVPSLKRKASRTLSKNSRSLFQASTGNPQLDAELEHEYDMKLWDHSKDSEYYGIMSVRDRDWIKQYQFSKVTTENPFVDDYYFAMYERKKQNPKLLQRSLPGHQQKDYEEGPQLLRTATTGETGQDKIEKKFPNSLGSIQRTTMKAPRKIIDVWTPSEKCQSIPLSLVNAIPNVILSQKELKSFKDLLLELEHLYDLLIETEDCEKKIEALPTNSSMWFQVESERNNHLELYISKITSKRLLQRSLLVHKGKALLVRSMGILTQDSLKLVYCTLFQIFPLALRRDREDPMLPLFWPHIRQHLKGIQDLEVLLQYFRILHNDIESYKVIIESDLGACTILLLIRQINKKIFSLDQEISIKQMYENSLEATQNTDVLEDHLESVLDRLNALELS